jgi:hypothetical protein
MNETQPLVNSLQPSTQTCRRPPKAIDASPQHLSAYEAEREKKKPTSCTPHLAASRIGHFLHHDTPRNANKKSDRGRDIVVAAATLISQL